MRIAQNVYIYRETYVLSSSESYPLHPKAQGASGKVVLESELQRASKVQRYCEERASLPGSVEVFMEVEIEERTGASRSEFACMTS